jgi:hypothetical protein
MLEGARTVAVVSTDEKPQVARRAEAHSGPTASGR